MPPAMLTAIVSFHATAHYYNSPTAGERSLWANGTRADVGGCQALAGC
jgi:hypothetical protein